MFFDGSIHFYFFLSETNNFSENFHTQKFNFVPG